MQDNRILYMSFLFLSVCLVSGSVYFLIRYFKRNGGSNFIPTYFPVFCIVAVITGLIDMIISSASYSLVKLLIYGCICIFIILAFVIVLILYKKNSIPFISYEPQINKFLENSMIGILVINSDSVIIEVNRAAASYLGVGQDELKNTCLLDLLGKDKTEEFAENLKLLAVGELNEIRFDLCFRMDLNIALWTEVRFKPVIPDDNSDILFFGTLNDITSRKRTEDELQYRLEFRDLITKMSSEFINISIDEIDKAINSALENSCKFSNADRCVVYLLDYQSDIVKLAYLWQENNIEKLNPQFTKAPLHFFEWWNNTLIENGDLYYSDVKDIPDESKEIREVFIGQKIKSFVAVPLFYSRKLIGFVGYDTVTRTMHRNDDTLSLLKIMSDIIANVLGRKSVETILRESEEKYRTLFNYAQDVIIIEDDQMNIIDANPAAEKLFGYTHKELLSMKTIDIQPEGTSIHPIYSNPVIRYDSTWVTLAQHKNGSILTVEMSISPLESKDRNYFISIVRDISEQQRARAELEKAHHEIKQIFNIASPLCEIDPGCRIIRVNDSFSRFFGIDKDEVIGRKCYSVLNGTICKKENCIVRDSMFSHLNFENEIDFVNPDGKIISCLVIASYNKSASGDILSIVENFTDKRKVQKELIDLNKTLEQRVKEEIVKHEMQQQYIVQKSKLESIGKLAAGMAHEINQPLGGITIALDNILLKFAKGEISEDYLKSKLKSVFDHIDRIRQFINHVRIFSRDQKTEISENVEIKSVILNALSMVQAHYQNHNVSVVLNMSESTGFVRGNKYKLEQVILNLLSNAKDAIEEKNKQTDAGFNDKRIKITTESEGDKQIIRIEDNGIGIPQENINLVFDPFFTTKSAEAGTGLGLSISYGIIKEMGGEITIQSKPNESTVMTIILPS
ncbi:MAG: PAS domain S-box protein [Bacteroidia bacterium]|nr:PAS domain S-box protein [Bacteroidia bacterium]